jgi:hypothetical protein
MRIRLLFHISLLPLLLGLMACSSGGGRHGGHKIASPTFAGEEVISVVTPNATYVLLGLCDVSSTGLEYSFDGTSWSPLAPDCAAGRFSLHVVVRNYVHVQVRAKTAQGFTEPAHATIEFAAKDLAPAGVRAPIAKVTVNQLNSNNDQP